MKPLTIENLKTFKEKCENTDKILRFTDCYLDPETIKEGLESLIAKINFTSMGIEELTPSDRLLLMLINAQRGFHF